jgi:hypothetical protein
MLCCKNYDQSSNIVPWISLAPSTRSPYVLSVLSILTERAKLKLPLAVPAVLNRERAQSYPPFAVPAVHNIERAKPKLPCAVPAVHNTERAQSYPPFAVPAVHNTRYNCRHTDHLERKSRIIKGRQ